MEPRKQRLMPWLYQKIEEAKTPGLHWVEKATLIFQMPWVHAKKKSYDMDRDAALYRSWAVNSGKYLPDRDEPDPTTWKINFRCALNSLRGYVNMVKSDEIEGYRRMQFNKRALEEQLELDQARTIGRKLLEAHSRERRSVEGNSHCDQLLRTLSDSCDHSRPSAMSILSSPSPTGRVGNMMVTAPPRPMSRSVSSISSPGSHNALENDDQVFQPARCQSNGSVGSNDSGLGKQRAGADDIEFIGTILEQLHENPVNVRYDIDITVYYYNKEVARYKVTNPQGCRVYYSPHQRDAMKLELEEHERFFGSYYRTQLSLPDPVFETPEMSRLLESMQRGILLDLSSNDLYATHYGRCAVYCNDTRVETTEAGKLGRYEKTKVFDYRGLFSPHFENHCANRGGCPSTELFFTFGQQWHNARPAEENLLSITVVHTLARSQVQKRSLDIYRPRQNLELEILKPTSEDEYVNILLGNVVYNPSAMQSAQL